MTASGGSRRSRTHKVQIARPREEFNVNVVNVRTNTDRPDLALPTARVDAVVPYVVGTNRIRQPNFIWYGNIRNIIETSIYTTTETIKTIPDGIESFMAPVKYDYVTTTNIERTVVGYMLDFALAICLGPNVRLLAIYAGEDRIWSGDLGTGRHVVNNTNPTNVPLLGDGFIFHSGEFDQTPDPYLANFVEADKLPGYVGVSYIIIKDVDASLLSGAAYSFEVQRMPDRLGLDDDNAIGPYDINPASAMADVILNQWGALGVDPIYVDTNYLRDAGARYALEGIGSSFVSYSENFGVGILGSLADQTRSIFYVDPESAKVRNKPLRALGFDHDAAVSLTASNITTIQRMEKDGWDEMPTHYRVDFANRSSDYENDYLTTINPAIVPTTDRARRMQQVTVTPANTQSIASKTLALMLTYESTPQLSFAVQANRVADDILPGEPFLVSWPDYGMAEFPVFATRIQEQGSTSNNILVTCEQYEHTEVSDFYGFPEPSQHVAFDMTPKPPTEALLIGTPFFFLTRGGFAQSREYLDTSSFPMILARGANEYQIVADVAVTSSGKVIREDMPFPLFARFAKRVKFYDGYFNYKSESIVIKDVVNPDYLVNQGITGARDGTRLIITEYEIMTFESFADNGDGTYTLNNVYRALLDTSVVPHDVDEPLYIVDRRLSRVMTYKVDDAETVNFTVYSRSHKGIENTGLAVEYTGDNRSLAPIRPQNCSINANRDGLTVVAPGETVDLSFMPRTRTHQVIFGSDLVSGGETFDSAITNDIITTAVYLIDGADNYMFLGTGAHGDASGANAGLSSEFGMTCDIPPGAAPGSAVLLFRAVRMSPLGGDPVTAQEGHILQLSHTSEQVELFILAPGDILVDLGLDYAINP